MEETKENFHSLWVWLYGWLCTIKKWWFVDNTQLFNPNWCGIMGKCLVMGISTIVTRIVKTKVDFYSVVGRHIVTHNFSFTKGECFENFNACLWCCTFWNTHPPLFIFPMSYLYPPTRRKKLSFPTNFYN